jgi:hypothetical protein
MSEPKQPLNAQLMREGEGRQDAVSIGHGIFMSRDISNAYRVVTPGGDVLINTGIVFSAEENFRRLSAVSGNRVAMGGRRFELYSCPAARRLTH